MPGISLLAEDLLASQEGLCYMQLVYVGCCINCLTLFEAASDSLLLLGWYREVGRDHAH